MNSLPSLKSPTAVDHGLCERDFSNSSDPSDRGSYIIRGKSGKSDSPAKENKLELYHMSNVG